MANSCKYYKQKEQFSTNSGQTWQDVTPFEYRRGSFIEADSPDCREGTLISRWVTVPDAFLCDGKNKYEKQVGQYSLDNGATWQYYYPSLYRSGNLIEANSEICHNKWEGYYSMESVCPSGYVFVQGRGCVPNKPSGGGGMVIYYAPDPVKYIRCSSTTSTTLTQADITYNNYNKYNSYYPYYGIIGDCVTSIDENAFSGCSSLTSLTIPSNVTSVGNYAFQYCTSLTSVGGEGSNSSIEIADGLTAINYGTFQRCYGLRNVTMPNSVTSIGQYAFYLCSGLTSVTLPSGLTSIGDDAFRGCSRLTSVTIPDSVTSINKYTFESCSGLRTCTIGSGVISIGDGAFRGCSSLTSLTIPDNVKTVDLWAFSACTSLTSLTIGSGITSINNDTFHSCSSLTSVTINATTPPRLHSSSAFDNTNNCPIFVPCDSVNAYKSANWWSNLANRIYGLTPCATYRWVESGTTCIGYDKYQNNIKQVSYDYVNWENVVPNEFSASTLIEAYSQDCGAPYNYKWLATYSDSHTESASCDTSSTITQNDINITNLTNVDINGCVTSITINSFSGASSLSSVTIADSVSGIGYNAFRGCVSLTQINLPTGLTYIADSLFYNCTALTQINLPTGLTIIYSYAFRNCQSLTSVTIPDSVTSIRQDAFNGCRSLTKIIINSITPYSLYSNVFDDTNNCPIYVPCESVNAYKSASDWRRYASRIVGDCPFSGKWLATYSDSHTESAQCDSSSAITNNEITKSGLTSVEIGDCVTSIGNSAFDRCSGLTSFDIPNSVTSIGNWAFYYCRSLTSVTIPDSVTSIGEYAFESCRSLTSITINATTPPTLGDTTVFSDTNNCPIYVPAASVEAYKSATNWSDYASRIQPIT